MEKSTSSNNLLSASPLQQFTYHDHRINTIIKFDSVILYKFTDLSNLLLNVFGIDTTFYISIVSKKYCFTDNGANYVDINGVNFILKFHIAKKEIMIFRYEINNFNTDRQLNDVNFGKLHTITQLELLDTRERNSKLYQMLYILSSKMSTECAHDTTEALVLTSLVRTYTLLTPVTNQISLENITLNYYDYLFDRAKRVDLRDTKSVNSYYEYVKSYLEHEYKI